MPAFSVQLPIVSQPTRNLRLLELIDTTTPRADRAPIRNLEWSMLRELF